MTDQSGRIEGINDYMDFEAADIASAEKYFKQP